MIKKYLLEFVSGSFFAIGGMVFVFICFGGPHESLPIAVGLASPIGTLIGICLIDKGLYKSKDRNILGMFLALVFYVAGYFLIMLISIIFPESITESLCFEATMAVILPTPILSAILGYHFKEIRKKIIKR